MKFLLATSNLHKAHEIASMLGNKVEVLTLKDVGFVDKIIEHGRSFEENARLKISHLLDWMRSTPKFQKNSSWVLLADDSGLEVDTLGGAPGVMSARYAGELSNDRTNVTKLLQALKGVPASKRKAQFRCVLVAAQFDFKNLQKPVMVMFEGVCRGKIGFKPKGQNGFGYDPVFFPEKICRTFAELDATEKNRISHRAQAMAKLKKWLQLSA